MTLPIESLCAERAFGLCDNFSVGDETRKRARKALRRVDNMLRVLESDGFYGVVVYLDAYRDDEKDLKIFEAFNGILGGLPHAQGETELPGAVTEGNFDQLKHLYAERYAGGDNREAAAEFVFRRLLLHLRFALKAAT